MIDEEASKIRTLEADEHAFIAGRNGDLPRALGTLSPRGVPVRSSLVLFALCTILAGAIALGVLPLTIGVSIAEQNFIFLYLAAIVAFARSRQAMVGMGAHRARGSVVRVFAVRLWNVAVVSSRLALVGYWNHWRHRALTARAGFTYK